MTPPRGIVSRLNSEILQVLAQPAVRDEFLKMGFEIVPNTPDEYAVFFKQEHARWGKVVKDLGLKTE